MTARRPLLVALVVVVLVVIVAIVAKVAGGGDGDGSAGGGTDGSGASAVPTPPASAPGRGSFIRSTVAADGSVSVQQWIRSNAPIRSLDVSVYDPDSGAPAAAEKVVVQSLDGTVLAQRASVGSDAVTLRLSTGVPNLYLSYRITGGDLSASQSVQGRSLLTVLGMDVTFSGTAGGVQREVVGPGAVTNVACLRVNGSADDAPKPCGSPTDDGGWLVDLRGIDRSDRLIAQVELSDASASASASAS